MTTPSEDFRRLVNAYLDQALDLRDDERASWLSRLDSENREIADELRALLREHEALVRERFLEDGPERPVDDPTLIGQNVGAYTIVAPIGRGGMGTVWLAVRSDGRFERRAAVKFLSVALSGHGDERFKREGAILARLHHPHIAQLLDAGVSPTGHPFLVLEYVDGEPIDRYCDNKRLVVDARISLFLDVLSAVAHAHANLVVHRDLKPSNVFVGTDGAVKLLDFGVAKLLEDEGQPGTPSQLTLDAGSAMTPQYAAPERLTGQPVTTAADIYSLGVLLYRLLTAQHPTARTDGSTAAMIKGIVDEEPRHASDAVVAGDAPRDRLVECATRRSTTPEKLRRALRGDLDTILAKALKKAPADRYATANDFANDLRRYLRHEPISAKPDTITYRASKFVRRNWLPLGAAALVFVGLAVGLVVVNRERVAAERRFRQLRQLSAKVFELDHAIRNLPGSIEARRQLVSTSLEYLESLSADVGGDPDLARELADGYWRVGRIQGVPVELNLGDMANAERSLAKADAFADAVLASRPRDRYELLRSGAIAQDRMILAESERRRADTRNHARRVVDRVQTLLALGPASNDERGAAASLLSNAALAHLNSHMYSDAEREASLELSLASSVPNATNLTSSALSLLASARRFQGNLQGALESIQQARDVAEHTNYTSPSHRMLDMYGILLRQGLIEGDDGGVSLGHPAAAIEALKQAFEMTEAAAQRDPSDSTSRSRVGTSGRELANILRHSDPQRALEVYDKALARLAEIRTNVKSRRDRAITLCASAEALRRLQRPIEARRRIEEALAILAETKDLPAAQLEFDSPAYNALIANIDQLDQDGQAGRALEEGRRLLTQVLPSADPQHSLPDAYSLSRLYERLAMVSARAGDISDAQATASKRVELWRGWEQTLRDNDFVRRQLEAAESFHAP